ncbi:hypothetical protein C7M84_023552 [Penaeus vannamei]|uniref:Uncharacterized protein n=1 Tax=Penaeus vannamei TaxID=6689 RepID=A0A3R7QLY6_PENVA|nr:hypothetical protein C7M84_023552 [Penaeus vannamei]
MTAGTRETTVACSGPEPAVLLEFSSLRRSRMVHKAAQPVQESDRLVVATSNKNLRGTVTSDLTCKSSHSGRNCRRLDVQVSNSSSNSGTATVTTVCGCCKRKFVDDDMYDLKVVKATADMDTKAPFDALLLFGLVSSSRPRLQAPFDALLPFPSLFVSQPPSTPSSPSASSPSSLRRPPPLRPRLPAPFDALLLFGLVSQPPSTPSSRRSDAPVLFSFEKI